MLRPYVIHKKKTNENRHHRFGIAGVGHRAKIQAAAFQQNEGEIFRERERSLVWLKRLKNAHWHIKYTSQWGSMPAGEMFASWVAHDNLHIRQLTELRRRLIEQKTKPYKIGYAGDW